MFVTVPSIQLYRSHRHRTTPVIFYFVYIFWNLSSHQIKRIYTLIKMASLNKPPHAEFELRLELILMVEDSWKDLNLQITVDNHVIVVPERSFIDWGLAGRQHLIELMK